ncbi:MAG: dephospho-CoA kinase [Bacilli bacterium]|nr:dephospho-CoA kinase [Bacilli bacterium]
MTKIIGITGLMGSGKSTLVSELRNILPNPVTFIDVDTFRRELIKDKDFFDNLRIKITGLNDYNDLNKLTYQNHEYMRIFKSELYKRLKEYILIQKGLIIIEWALIIDDNLIDWFDQIIIINCSKEVILERLSNGDLLKEEIIKRLSLQLPFEKKIITLQKANKPFMVINSEIGYDLESIVRFIGVSD